MPIVVQDARARLVPSVFLQTDRGATGSQADHMVYDGGLGQRGGNVLAAPQNRRRGVQVDPSVPGVLVERAAEDAVVLARMDVRASVRMPLVADATCSSQDC